MSPALAEAQSLALYLVPAAVLLALTARRSLSPRALALGIPLVVSIDLLTVLVASRLFPLEVATLLSRAAWLVGGALVLARRGPAARPAWPTALGRRALAAVGIAAALALGVSVLLSRKYIIYDRHWHGLLVPTIATQRLPFTNVFGGDEILHYHFGGDVLAAELRALSFNVLSSNRALSMEHDLLFAACAAAVALAMITPGRGRMWPASIAGMALLLSGPMPLRGFGHELSGYAFYPFLNLSYRPHVPLAALMMIGLGTALFARLERAPERLGAGRALLLMMACFATLSIADEASAALLGVGLALTWLFYPHLLGARRRAGLLALAALALSTLVPNLLFSASLAPGGPVTTVTWAAARVPSVFSEHPALPLGTTRGLLALGCDLLPVFLCAIGLLLAARRDRDLRPAALFALAVTIVGLTLGTHVDINHDASEAQRFFIAPFFATLGPALLVLGQRGPRIPAKIALLLGAALSPFFTILWLGTRMPTELKIYVVGYRSWLMDDVFQVDCRARTGARLFEVARPTYVESTQFFLFSTCRPILAAGGAARPWPTKIYPHFEPIPQLRELEQSLAQPDAPLDAICRAHGGPNDLVCARALTRREACRAEGSDFLRCPLLAADRRALLRRDDRPAKAR